MHRFRLNWRASLCGGGAWWGEDREGCAGLLSMHGTFTLSLSLSDIFGLLQSTVSLTHSNAVDHGV